MLPVRPPRGLLPLPIEPSGPHLLACQISCEARNINTTERLLERAPEFSANAEVPLLGLEAETRQEAEHEQNGWSYQPQLGRRRKEILDRVCGAIYEKRRAENRANQRADPCLFNKKERDRGEHKRHQRGFEEKPRGVAPADFRDAPC